MSLNEYKIVMEELGNRISADAKIISGAQISADMEKSIKVLLILTGVQSTQILGTTIDYGKSSGTLGSELGIDFVEN